MNEYTKHVKYSDVFPANTGRWAGVGTERDDGPASDQQWFVVSCLLGNRYVFLPYKIYMNLMTLTHGTTFLEHVSIKYVTRFYCISIIYIQLHLIICT